MKYSTSALLASLFFIININACHLKNQETKTENQTSAISDDSQPNQKAPSNTKPAAANDMVVMDEYTPDTLIGRWLRPDGNYIIQIDNIREDKSIEARYFNPRPIHIARAEILPAEDLRIYIEFKDVGYEGSSYDLIYDPVNDALTGNYYQATYGQTYQIGFIRMDD